MIELRLAHFENLPKNDIIQGKFIISKDDNFLSFYNALFDFGSGYKHKRLIESFNLSDSNIIGGGYIFYADKKLVFNKSSLKYGFVPNKVMVEFSNMIKKSHSRHIDEIIVDMFFDSNFKNMDMKKIKVWNDLGYVFDNSNTNILNYSD